MPRNTCIPFAMLLPLLLLAGCGPQPILTQSIPVTSSPLGAIVYVDGQIAGRTPMSVNLTRNRDHLVTLVQTGYRQANILIQRQYLQGDVMTQSMEAGINTGTFFNSPAMGINAALNAVQQAKDTGAAYQLVPPAVTLTMLPAGTPSPPGSIPQYHSDPTYPVQPPPAPDQSGVAAAIGATLGTVAGSDLPDYNKEQTRSKTTSRTTSDSYIDPSGATVTNSTTKSNSSGTFSGFGFNTGNSPDGSQPASTPAGSNFPSMPSAPVPAMPTMQAPTMP